MTIVRSFLDVKKFVKCTSNARKMFAKVLSAPSYFAIYISTQKTQQ